jgi:hypothetical protein
LLAKRITERIAIDFAVNESNFGAKGYAGVH